MIEVLSIIYIGVYNSPVMDLLPDMDLLLCSDSLASHRSITARSSPRARWLKLRAAISSARLRTQQGHFI